MWGRALACLVIAGLTTAGCDDAAAPCTTDSVCQAGLICVDKLCAAPSASTRGALDEVAIPAGAFSMGCDPATDDRCQPYEQPAHAVTTPAYRIDKAEVSARDFADFLSVQSDNTCGDGKCVRTSNPTLPLESSDTVTWTPRAGMSDRPMTDVRWHGAKAYCEWRGQELCSEAQWEKAARGGCELHAGDCASATPRFPWGDAEPDCSKAHMDDGGVGCGTDATTAVSGTAAGASPYGLVNMAGNVWEWVSDDYHGGYTDAPSDGTTWTTPATKWRVYKGGGARSDRSHLRGATRGNGGPDDANEYRGFRCCRW